MKSTPHELLAVARGVLHIWQHSYPGDHRPQAALETANAALRGEGVDHALEDAVVDAIGASNDAKRAERYAAGNAADAIAMAVGAIQSRLVEDGKLADCGNRRMPGWRQDKQCRLSAAWAWEGWLEETLEEEDDR